VSRALPLPRLYLVIDSALLRNDVGEVVRFAADLLQGGASVLQYRNKTGSSRDILSHSRELRRMTSHATLIMNDRADLCLGAAFDGVHLGQDDLSAEAARTLLGSMFSIGVSAHNAEQVREADGTSADYVAIGPVFPTRSKQNPDPVIGLEGVGQARAATRKPLVAIGGITRANCRDVMAAGADSVAVISDLLDSPRKSVEAFLRILE
jgi:thiamine-phosphate pyrophosphorylase